MGQFQSDESFREHTVYSLSFAGDSSSIDPESDDDDTILSLIDDRMKRQLRNSYNALISSPSSNAIASAHQKVTHTHTRLVPPQLSNLAADSEALLCANERIERKLPPMEGDDDEGEEASDEYYHYRVQQPLPKTVDDISSSSKLDEDARAIVVTDTKNPFRIVAVNAAWEDLCGYRREECRGDALGPLLHGPETDACTVTAMLSRLLAGEEAGAVLINYTKDGKRFRNNIRVGPVVDEMGKTVNFVGVLREVKDDNNDDDNFGGDGRTRMQLPFLS